MKKFFIHIAFCFSITMYAPAMIPFGDNTHVQRSGVLSLKDIALNTLAKEKAHSYLSRPNYSELAQTEDVLRYMIPDLLAEVTSTQSKSISFAHLALPQDITELVESSDSTRVVMTSPDGSLIGMDIVTQEIHQKKILFNNPAHIYADNDQSWDQSYEKSLSQDYASSDDALSSDGELASNHEFTNDDDWASGCVVNPVVINHESIYRGYIKTALSPDGNVWGAISPEHNDTLLVGSVSDLFDLQAGSYVQNYDRICVAQQLYEHYGTLHRLALRSNGLQCAAVWETMSTLFNNTQTLLFCGNDGSVQQTIEIPRVNMFAYAHHEPLLAASHEMGVVSLWNAHDATQHFAIKFFESEELITAIGFSCNDDIIYVGTVMGNISALNRVTLETIQRSYAHNDTIKIIQSHPQGLCVVTASDDGKVILWNKDITKKVATFAYRATALNFSKDGTFLYVTTENKQFHRIPLGNPWELLCLRAWMSCKNDHNQREAFKDWGIYKKVMSQEVTEKGILGEQLHQYLATHCEQ